LKYKQLFYVGAAALLVAVGMNPEWLLQIPGVSGVVEQGRIQYELISSGKQYVPVLTELLKPVPKPSERVPAAVADPKPVQAPPPVVSKTFYLTLRVTPAGSGTEITVNGNKVSSSAPLIELPYDQPISVQVSRPKFKVFSQQMTVSAAQVHGTGEYLDEVALEPETFGYMSVKADLNAEVHVRELDPNSKMIPQNSSTWYYRTRFEMEKFPPGLYLVQLTDRPLDLEATKVVEVKRNLIARVDDIDLKPSDAAQSTNTAPDKILGLLGWFRAGVMAGTRQGDPISNWTSASKNLMDFTQPDPAARPVFFGDAINGQAAIRFDGVKSGMVSDSMAANMRGLKSMTLITVARAAIDQSQTLMSCSAADKTTVFSTGLEKGYRVSMREANGSFEEPARGVASTNKSSVPFSVYSMVVSSMSAMIFQNGEMKLNLPSESVDFSRAAHCTMGGAWTDGHPSNFFRGDIAEVLVYDHALSSREQQSVEHFLGQVYGVTVKK
jgi:hypothetical protein